jgi:hypothetical protein
LMQNVGPLPPTRPKEWKRNTETAVEYKMYATMDRYEEVMGDWIRTRDIERRAGLAKCSAFGTLQRYEAAGLVERRPYQNLPYNQRRGWEWRWK